MKLADACIAKTPNLQKLPNPGATEVGQRLGFKSQLRGHQMGHVELQARSAIPYEWYLNNRPQSDIEC